MQNWHDGNWSATRSIAAISLQTQGATVSKAPISRGSGRTKKRKKRITIADIAERAGVTTAAVSLAVNGKRGVSDTTRQRILDVARELNWQPNRAAQALMGKATEAIGLVINRSEEALAEETFLSKYIGGVQLGLSVKGYSLLMQMVEDPHAESDLHEKWVHDKRVDGIIMLDPRLHDSRIAAVRELDCPVLVVGGDINEGNVRSLLLDETAAMRGPLEFLHGLGHKRVAFVTGDQTYRTTRIRMAEFERYCAEYDLTGQIIPGNFSPAKSRTGTGQLMHGAKPPTAIIYDTEAMALAGISIIYSEGYSAPADFSVISLEDSKICEVIHPSMTALNRDAAHLGVLTATEMLAMITQEVNALRAVRTVVLPRESTGPPRASAR